MVTILAFLRILFYSKKEGSLIYKRYGQTGSGKTYTMEGPPRSMENSCFGMKDEHRGMIPRTVWIVQRCNVVTYEE